MIKGEYRDREFSENIDRLLAGETVDLESSVDDDFRTAFEFAQKMAAAGPSPSSRFKADLKVRLLHQLTQREEKKRTTERSWFVRLVRQPVWQAAAAAVFVVIVVTTLWATGVFTQGPGETVPPGTILAVSGDTGKTAYAPGEPVDIEVSLKNVTDGPFTVDRFPPILSLMSTDTRQAVYTFAAGSTTVTLDPGQERDFTVRWDQRDARGLMVPAGSYFLELEDIEYQGEPVKLTFVQTVRFDIRPQAPS